MGAPQGCLTRNPAFGMAGYKWGSTAQPSAFALGLTLFLLAHMFHYLKTAIDLSMSHPWALLLTHSH